MSRKPDADLYVAANGDDAFSGTLPGPNAERSDGPFATLDRARSAVRTLRSKRAAPGPVTVMIRGGVYRVHEAFTLKLEDSGDADAPITYAAYPGERPVISGARSITGWRKSEGPLWAADVPDVRAGKWCFRQLFIDGARRTRGRWPADGVLYPEDGLVRAADEGVLKIAGPADPPAGGDTAKDEWHKRSFRFVPGDIRKDWRNIEDVEIVVLQMWMAARLRIESIDEENHTVAFTGGSWRPLTWSFGYYVDNLFEGLATPGAWYLDGKQGILYYHPLPGEDMAEIEAVAPVAEQLVRIEGDVAKQRLVRNVTFSGLAFHHTSWTLPATGYACNQAEITPPAAVEAQGAVDCRFERCELGHLGAWGIGLGRGCRDNAIVGSTVHDIGAGCVKVGEPKNCAEDSEEACRTTISDNRFLDGGKIHLGPAAVWIGQSSGNTVSHNEISGGFHWAVSVGWNWSYFPLNRARDNIVEFNHVHHLGTGILGTHGAIYCLGVSPGTVVRNNHVHHVYSNDHWGAGEGIILDNGCSGILIENNVVHHASAGGWGCNFNCFGNIIVNNIFAFGTKFQLTRYGDPPNFGDGTKAPPPNGEVFARNIVVWDEGRLLNEEDWWAFQTLWDYNLYFCSGSEPVRFMKYSFDEWQAKGLDENSIISDPLFVDAERGNFSLRPESPALALGFKPIDISDVGPRA